MRIRRRRGPEPHRPADPTDSAQPAPALVPTPGAVSPAGPARRVRRDRRGRGLRGPLAPPEVPLHRSRADRFADLVLDAVERLEGRWRRELAEVEFAVESVPPVDAIEAARDADTVPLCRLYRGGAGHNARIVLYRRAVEARAPKGVELAALVQDLITERVAELLGVDPEVIDPDYGLD